MKLEWAERKCALCGSARGRVFAEANIDLDRLDEFAFASRKLPEHMHPRLVECAECGLLYASPSLRISSLREAYATASFDTGQEARLAAAVYAAKVREINPIRAAALDIGTGDGAFLEHLLAMGFESVTGVEPSKAPIAAARPDIRARIVEGLFRAEDFTPRSFSLVTCFQTMEHVPDPLSVTRAAYQLLQPGGVFTIVVHNRRALSARLLGLKSPIFDIEHLQLFCPVTARRMLESVGFQRVSVSALWNTYPLRYWMRLFPLPVDLKRALLAICATRMGSLKFSLPAGNLICTGFVPGSQ